MVWRLQDGWSERAGWLAGVAGRLGQRSGLVLGLSRVLRFSDLESPWQCLGARVSENPRFCNLDVVLALSFNHRLPGSFLG